MFIRVSQVNYFIILEMNYSLADVYEFFSFHIPNKTVIVVSVQHKNHIIPNNQRMCFFLFAPFLICHMLKIFFMFIRLVSLSTSKID